MLTKDINQNGIHLLYIFLLLLLFFTRNNRKRRIYLFTRLELFLLYKYTQMHRIMYIEYIIML